MVWVLLNSLCPFDHSSCSYVGAIQKRTPQALGCASWIEFCFCFFLVGWPGKEKSLWDTFRQESEQGLLYEKPFIAQHFFICNARIWCNTVYLNHSKKNQNTFFFFLSRSLPRWHLGRILV